MFLAPSKYMTHTLLIRMSIRFGRSFSLRDPLGVTVRMVGEPSKEHWFAWMPLQYFSSGKNLKTFKSQVW